MWKPDHVVVLGAGAMGSLSGGSLSEGGLNVTLVDVWQEHVDAINRAGLGILGHGGDRRVRIRATTDPSSVEQADVVLVQCEAFHTVAALEVAPYIGAETTVISLQNGLGNEETIAEIIGPEKVMGGVTALGCSIVEPGAIRTFTDLPTNIGELAGGVSERARRIAEAFSAAGFQTVASAEIRRDFWKKLMANIAVSPTSAITGLTLGDALKVDGMRDVMVAALTEAASIAQAEGIDLSLEEAKGVFEQITGKGGTLGNKSSMCVDLLNERPCEIDVINGAIARLGRTHGIATPVNDTLVAAVKGREAGFRSEPPA